VRKNNSHQHMQPNFESHCH